MSTTFHNSTPFYSLFFFKPHPPLTFPCLCTYAKESSPYLYSRILIKRRKLKFLNNQSACTRQSEALAKRQYFYITSVAVLAHPHDHPFLLFMHVSEKKEQAHVLHCNGFWFRFLNSSSETFLRVFAHSNI